MIGSDADLKAGGHLQRGSCQADVFAHQELAVLPMRMQASEDTLSDGSAGGVEEGSFTFGPCRDFVDDWATVSEPLIAEAMVNIRCRPVDPHTHSRWLTMFKTVSCSGRQSRGQH